MKPIKLILVVTSVLLISMSECQKEDINNASTSLPACNPWGLSILKNVKDAEATVSQYVRQDPNGNQIYYLIKYPSVPTGYLGVCNLPESFKHDGIRIRFSGKIYAIEGVELKNLNSIPAELTEIEDISGK